MMIMFIIENPSFHITRHASLNLYTVEFIGSVIVLLICLMLKKFRHESKSLTVYLLTGLGHSIVELIIEGLSVRMVEESLLFGIVPLNYPWICFILGYFEGGIFCLIAFYVFEYGLAKENFTKKMSFGSGLIILLFGIINGMITQFALTHNPENYLFTQRQFFTIKNIIIYGVFLLISVIFVLFTRKLWPDVGKGLKFYYWGLVWVTFVFIFPAHIFGIRYITIVYNGIQTTGSIWTQIIMMYGLQLFVDGTCTLIQYYPILFLIEKRQKKKSKL